MIPMAFPSHVAKSVKRFSIMDACGTFCSHAGFSFHLGMGQKPGPQVNIPIPTKIGSKMGGEFTYPPKRDPKAVWTTTAI